MSSLPQQTTRTLDAPPQTDEASAPTGSKMKLIIDRATLKALHKRAASAAHRARYIDNPEEFANEIDAIAHELSELLGNPHLRGWAVPDAFPRFAADEVTRTDLVTRYGAPAFVEPEASAASCTHVLSLPLGDEASEEPALMLDPHGVAAASTLDDAGDDRAWSSPSRRGLRSRRPGRPTVVRDGAGTGCFVRRLASGARADATQAVRTVLRVRRRCCRDVLVGSIGLLLATMLPCYERALAWVVPAR